MNPTPEIHYHECQSTRNGDWIVYTCPECDYEMRENWRTGKMMVRNAKADIHHSGSYFPLEYLEAFLHQN